MASTYSSSLNLEIQTTGENSGTWGTIVNNNLQKLESAIKGYVIQWHILGRLINKGGKYGTN